jgi:hypothetical protein
MYILQTLALSWCVRGTLLRTSIITHLTLTCGDCRSRKRGMTFSAGSKICGLPLEYPEYPMWLALEESRQGRLGSADCAPRPDGSAYSSHCMPQSRFLEIQAYMKLIEQHKMSPCGLRMYTSLILAVLFRCGCRCI